MDSAGETVDDGLDRRKVRTSKQVQVIEQVIQVVKVPAFLVTGVQGESLVVSPIKRVGQAAEQFRHGQVAFPESEINRGIKNTGLLIRFGLEIIARP